MRWNMREQLKKKDQRIDELGAKVQRQDRMLDRMAVEMKNKGERLEKMEAEMAEIKALLAARG